MVDVAANYRAIQGRIAEAALRSSREPGEIKLLAAAKSQSIEAIRAAIAAGIKLIGENYVQEAQDKRRAISETAEWHMIGHLQRNKAKVAVELFGVIESLDNVALARELAKEGRKKGKNVRIGLKELSMGMTHDYTVAIEEGATIVRIGTALFGPRKT